MKSFSCCEIMTHWYDQLWNQRDPAPIDTVLADQFVLHAFDGTKITKQGFREFFNYICNGFSELHIDVLDQLEEGHRCAMRLGCQATVASTGKNASFQMMAIVRFNDEGLAVEAWDTIDWFGYLTEIGALPKDTLQRVIDEGKTFAVQSSPNPPG